MCDVQVDCQLPGGNIVVDQIQDGLVRVHQDLRDTQGDWFYWYFRLRGGAGRTLRIEFTNGNVVGVLGPAVSDDAGATWRWLGRQACLENGFAYEPSAGAAETRFCVAVPYVQADLHRFLQRFEGSALLRQEVLCRTGKGREVEMLRLGRLDGRCRHRLLVVCRHHCCEMMASFVLEGILQTVLSDAPLGRWFQDCVEVLAIPFVDKDGVEDGDQGKNRRPHDHNRDYGDESIYSSVRAIRELVPAWSAGRLKLALDLHCPYIRKGRSEEPFFVQAAAGDSWGQIERLTRLLAAARTGPIPLKSQSNLPFGQEWNTDDGGMCRSFSRWASELPGVRLACTLEIPYALAGGCEVTPESARAFGLDLAAAIHRVLEDEE